MPTLLRRKPPRVIGLAIMGALTFAPTIAPSFTAESPSVSIPTFTTLPAPIDLTTTFAAVGDSMTEWTVPSPTASNPWVYVAQNPDLTFIGGFAQSGDKTYEMLAGMQTNPPFTANVLVILAGRNDVTLVEDEPDSWSIPQSMATIQQIAAQSGIHHILLSAIAPCGPDCDTYNTSLHTLALDEGWGWVDPWVTLTDPTTDLYYPQMTVDGVHPTSAGYTVVGLTIRDALTTMCANMACGATG